MLKTVFDGETWHTVLLPFRASGKDDAHVLWTTNPNYEHPVHGLEAIHFEPIDRDAYWKITEFVVTDGGIETTTDEVENFLGCKKLDWGCILSLAAAYGGTIMACYVCYQTAGWLISECARCVLAILGSGGVTLTCPWCKD